MSSPSRAKKLKTGHLPEEILAKISEFTGPNSHPNRLPDEILAKISKFTGPKGIKALAMTNTTTLQVQHRLQLFRKELKKAILYTICLYLDPSLEAKKHRRHSFSEVALYFTNPAHPGRIVFIQLSFGLSQRMKLRIVGGGREPLVFENGIRTDNQLEFNYHLNIRQNKDDIFTFVHWLLGKYGDRIDMEHNDIREFSRLYEEIYPQYKTHCRVVASNPAIEDMKACIHLVMNRY
jgi:hypothetical protein